MLWYSVAARVPLPTVSSFMPELAESISLFDSRRQTQAHRLAVVLIGAAGLLAFVCYRRRLRFLASPLARELDALVQMAGRPGCLVALLLLLQIPGSHVRSTLVYLIALLAAYVWLQRRVSSRMRIVGCALIIAAYLAQMMMVPVIRPIDLSVLGPDGLAFVEAHFSVVVGASDQVGAGRVLFENVEPNYSLLWPTLLGAFQAHFGSQSFGWHIRLIQALQIVFVLVLLVCYRLYRPMRIEIALVALLMFVPHYSPANSPSLYPNQTAYRLLGLLFGVAALLLTRRASPQVRAIALGCVSMAAILYNMETGICVALGLLAAGMAEHRFGIWKELSAAALWYLTGAIGFMALVMIGYRMEFGYWPLPHSLGLLLRPFVTANRGFGGLPITREAMPLFLIFIHASIVLIHRAGQFGRRRLSFEGRLQLAVATTIVVWSAYFANRPATWNLYSYVALYTFLLPTLIDRRLLGLMRFRPSRFRFPMKVLVAAAISGFMINAAHRDYWGWRDAWAMNTSTYDVVSGTRIRSDLAAILRTKSDFLRNHPDHGNLVYVTANSYLMPILSGDYLDAPVRDAFWYANTTDRFHSLVDRILARAPSTVLMDAPGTFLDASQPQSRFFQRLADALRPQYEERRTVAGWVELSRR
jgi:hypothetical protein